MELDRQKGLVLGVTGSAGSGKSTVTQMLATLGAQTADADALVRWAYNDPGFRDRVAKRFGRSVVDEAGEVDRGALAQVVFHDPEALGDLERIVHPAVLSQMADRIEEYRRDPERAPVLALEIPLLYETGAEAMVDRVVAVSASADVRASRLKQRGWSPERIEAVERFQMPPAEKESRADYVLEAKGTLSETALRVDELWRDLLG